MNLGFTYGGVVESNRDPLKLGRLKVRVPHVYGSQASGAGYIGTNDIPWALPAGMPAGGSGASGGFSMLPEPGDKVWVRFLDGEPEKPLWEWGMQSADDAKKLKLHAYDPGTPVGKPSRTLWTRYSHAFEMNPGSLIALTSQGYRLVITDATEVGTFDGNITLQTPNGNSIAVDDLDDTIRFFSVNDLYFNIANSVTGLSDEFSWTTLTDSFSVRSGNSIDLTSVESMNLTTASDFTLDSLGAVSISSLSDMVLDFAKISIGAASTEPAVLGARLVAWMTTLLTYLSVHTHTSTTPGTPTSPPIVPPIAVQPLPEEVLSVSVTVKD